MPATDRKPTWLTKKWLDSQAAALRAERDNYTRSSTQLANEAAELLADRDPGDTQFDEESGEGDTIAVERDRALALSSKAVDKIHQIDDAMARITAGTYGRCVTGGCIIAKARLEALPMAAKCVEHQASDF